MDDAYVLVQSKIYLCYTCDDRPYKIKQSDERRGCKPAANDEILHWPEPRFKIFNN